MLYKKNIFAGFIPNLKTSTPNNRHPKQCMWDLKTDYLYSDNEIDIAYFDYSKYTPVKNDVMYAAEAFITDENGNPEDCGKPFFNDCNSTDIFGLNTLRYKAYYPKSSAHNYITTPLAVVILFHAGGYAECSQLELALMKTFCMEFARKGFIAMTCEYRRGILKDASPYTTAQQELALYKGQQDGRGLIRSVIKRNRQNQHDGKFVIDEDQFFIGGASAGSVIALSCAYYNETMISQVFPNKVGKPTIQDALGPLQADYYGDVPDETHTYWPKIAGVFNCWGGVFIPKSYDSHEYDFFSLNPDDKPPMISFQGELDQVFPYFDNDPQNVYYSQAPINLGDPHYEKENSCLLISPNYFFDKPTPLDKTKVKVKVGSTLNMYCILKALNKYTEHYADSDMRHGLDMNSDFGIDTTTYDVQLYLVHRAATFFQAVMNGVSTFGFTGRSYFRDCENFRVKCNPANNNECTGSEDICS